MDKFIIQGSTPLRGDIPISGAKNAALPLLAAALLTAEPVTLHNIPHLHDVDTLLTLLQFMGAKIQREASSVTLCCQHIHNTTAPYELVRTMRASIVVLGPLLSRFGYARVSLPGGCAIGTRPVNLHIHAMQQLGADITLDQGYICAKIPQRLQGTRIIFDKVTVTGTENAMMAAVLAEGTTLIDNAACEPEVIDLAYFLNSLGAVIHGAGTTRITIEGVSALHGGEYTVLPDRIEAGTYLAAGVITRGCVQVSPVIIPHMRAITNKLAGMGAVINTGLDWISADMQGRRPIAVDIVTGPFPEFPTDMQAQLLAINTVASGSAQIHETIFENRFMHAQELSRMGANITVENHTVRTVGVEKLQGASVMATDLRASASLVLAGMAAEGETIISRIYHIDRGYERIEDKLNAAGARVTRTKKA